MKKTYKDLFSEIKPDDELLLSLMNSRKKTSHKNFYIAATACIAACTVVVFCCFASVSYKSKSSVNIPVAYETRLQSEPQKHIGKSIIGNKKAVEIDADVIIEGNIKNLKVYTASVKHFSEKKLFEVLYGENGFYFGDKNKTGMFTTELGALTFDVNIDIENNSNLNSKGTDFADGCDYSYSDAKKLADMFTKKYNVENFCFKEGRIEKSFSPFYGNWRSGFYIFNYVQYADGFAIETATSDVDSSVASNLIIKMDNEGIVGLNIFGLDLTEKEALNGNIISVESAIDIIEKNIDGLWLSEFAPIIEIRLEYILCKNVNNSHELVPCWHFCIDQSELKTLDIQTQRENDTNDLCINAVTGEFYRVADRYPVFQTSDGFISTWNN